MPRNGQYWYGKGGFAYKKNTGSGVRKVFPYGLIMGVPANVNNKYISGAGVGGQSLAVRRAKLINATVCNNDQQCGTFAKYLGIHPKNSGQGITFESGLGSLGYNIIPSTLLPIRKPNQVIIDSYRNIIYN
jgi:hypothetical protein